MDVFMIKKKMLKTKIDGLYEAGLKEPESTRHKLEQKYEQIFTLKKRSNISWVHYHDLLIHIVLQIHPRHQP
jgi:hypothetical protein